jgi:hypothetical protein
MALNIQGYIDATRSHALASGWFDAVNGHEPKSAPHNGITGAVWVDQIDPVKTSGLASTSVRLTLNVRIYTNMLTEPQDAIDPNVVGATDALMGAYSADFTLGGLARHVDLLGIHGVALAGRAGYLNQDNRLFRVMTITLPVIVNDVWDQVA